MERGFWNHLKKPIIGLAPMDGVTDAAFRYITAKYGKPDLHMTEFTSVEGICAGAIKPLQAFIYDEIERPIVAQIFGSTPEAFYKTAFVVAELGFDGIDINMGCPAKNVASKGSGAGLIQTPELAKEIVRKTKQGALDWAKGKLITEVGLPEIILEYVKKNQRLKVERRLLPVSVKTRIGYNSVVIEEWVKHLLETEPVNIEIHGRTLKQMYTGNADWEAITRAAHLIHQTETTVLGNGDIKNLEDAHEKIKYSGVDGVLIGRAAFGNPWVFQTHQEEEIALRKKLNIAFEHTQIYEKIFGTKIFLPVRKHLNWYCRGFANASFLRQQLMGAENSQEVENILKLGSTTINDL